MLLFIVNVIIIVLISIIVHSIIQLFIDDIIIIEMINIIWKFIYIRKKIFSIFELWVQKLYLAYFSII